jgi:hypothetical protein
MTCQRFLKRKTKSDYELIYMQSGHICSIFVHWYSSNILTTLYNILIGWLLILIQSLLGHTYSYNNNTDNYYKYGE